MVEADQDPAQELYAKIDDFKLPVPDQTKSTDEDYEKQFMAGYKAVVMERGSVIFELCTEFPGSRRTASLFDAHWNSVMKTNLDDGDLEKYIGQIAEIINEETPDALKQQGSYWNAFLSSFKDKDDSKAMLDHAEEFANNYPTDQRGVTLYNFATVAEGSTVSTMTKAYRAIIDKYPSSQQVNRAKSILPLLPHVGKTIELDFIDNTTGNRVTTASLRGKVVVVDFWATWCQPCIDAMPYMKQVYADYKNKGVEFVGVSMDVPMAQGGLADMQRFVKTNNIEWPQHYAGEDPQLPAKYSVTALPTMFIVDKKGVIRTVDGYTVLLRTLDQLLEE